MNDEATQLLREIRDFLEEAAERDIAYQAEARKALKLNRIALRGTLSVLVVAILVVVWLAWDVHSRMSVPAPTSPDVFYPD